MVMSDYPKHVKRALRKLAEAAYEAETRRVLSELVQSFDAWRAGNIDVWELDRRIHVYHNGEAREIHKFYNTPRVDMLVGYAIVHGMISEDSVPAELAPYLERQIAFYHHLDRENQAGTSLEQHDEEG
jgi:hypothetical protein